MVTLYTWVPPEPLVALAEKILPDVGHSALEVKNGDEQRVYASFWPEQESLIGELTQRFKPRQERHPSSYAEESDPAQGYMQRPAESIDVIGEGLDEDRIVDAWKTIVESQYDFLHWNCSNVTRYLLVNAMASDVFENIQDAASVTLEDLRRISSLEDFREKFRYLATSRFIESRPDDVRRLVQAYNALKEGTAGAVEEAVQAVKAAANPSPDGTSHP